MADFLKKVVTQKKKEVKTAKSLRPLGTFSKKLRKSTRNFRKALKRKGRVALIAEIKKSSPSAGKIIDRFNFNELVSAYDKYADAISVLTDRKFFNGSLGLMRKVSGKTRPPVLRKDFIIDEYQIYEARLYGADAVLLIANILTEKQINDFIRVADSFNMDCLVEVDSATGLKKALSTRADIIGINNRNLSTLRIDMGRFERIAKKIPKKKLKRLVVVAESGYDSRQDIEGLTGRADAVLVGTAISGAPSHRTKLRALKGETLVKICGVTNVKDALNAVRLGTDFIGMNFYSKSPRHVNAAIAGKISGAVHGKAVVVGVFVNEPAANVKIIARKCGLDCLQFSGDESPSYVKQFKLPIIKAIHVEGRKSIAKANSYNANYLMFDAPHTGEYGGTGKMFRHGLLSGIGNARPFFVAGGLTSENVGMVVKKLGPFAVDVASGVEERPGKKSYKKMKQFISEVRRQR